MAAYGPLNLGFVGLHGLWNHPEAPYPCGASLNHPDHVASKILALGVLAALDHRNRTGEGEYVTLAQIDAAAFLLGEVYLDGFLNGADRTAQGNASHLAAPHGVFPSAGDDSWVAIAVHDEGAWRRLVAAVGLEDRAEWSDLAGRQRGRQEIETYLAAWTAERSAEDAAALLQARGVSAMVVMGPHEHLADEHLAARGFIVELQHPEVGSERHPGNPIRLSALTQRTAASAPCLGAHTEEVLTEVLGLSPRQVSELVERGVCR
jgi:benzylsuccinate CoA-transferase BbsF subunit